MKCGVNMCGRYSISVSKAEMLEYLEKNFNIKLLDDKIELPKFNVAPSQDVLSIINDGVKYRVGLLKWGFIPENSKDDKRMIINAKSETIDKLSSFQKSFYQRRCIIIADGFYEWERTTSTKTPYRFALKNKKIFGFAGLWSSFVRVSGEKVYTCAIITTVANDLIKSIHDRMPVILNEEESKIWLNPQITDKQVLKAVLKPYESDELELFQVSSKVNNVSYDEIDCLEQIKKPAE